VYILHLFTYRLLIVSQVTLIDVKCVFSQGQLLLSHVRSCLSVHSTRVLLCLGKWSTLDLVKDGDVRACLTGDEADEAEDNVAEGWDRV
jgi:hypothetical protein